MDGGRDRRSQPKHSTVQRRTVRERRAGSGTRRLGGLARRLQRVTGFHMETRPVGACPGRNWRTEDRRHSGQCGVVAIDHRAVGDSTLLAEAPKANLKSSPAQVTCSNPLRFCRRQYCYQHLARVLESLFPRPLRDSEKAPVHDCLGTQPTARRHHCSAGDLLE